MFNDFKPVLKILLRFVILYLVLVMLYQWYLNATGSLPLDPFSRFVAEQSAWILNLLHYPTLLVDGEKYKGVYFLIKNHYVSRMVEGCNAISIMIMFIAFVFAFYKGRKTIVYTLVGLLILHIMNVLRISGLNIVLSDHKEYGKIFHDYVFPAVIYGTVVVLWIVWIKFFALKTNDERA